MRKLYICTIVLIFLSACGDSLDYTDKTLYHFRNTPVDSLHISNYAVLEKYDLLMPYSVIKRGNIYYIWDETSRDSIIVRFNTKDSTMIRGISYGQGPGELLPSIKFRDRRDTLFIYDTNRNQYYTVDENDKYLYISKYKTYPARGKDAERTFDVRFLPNGYITTGLQGDAWLATYDNRDSLLTTITYPRYPSFENVPNRELGFVYSGSIVILSPDERKIISASRNGSSLFFGTIEEGNRIREVKRWDYQEPELKRVRISENDYAHALTINTIEGFTGVACTDKYVYAVYSGRTVATHGLGLQNNGEYLLVYDWDGNPVRHYVLEIPLRSVGYEEETGTLYGISQDPEGALVEYKLNEEGL
ncbi:MAG: TolB-like 6-bladed beta-propeller domain-containing protein [Prevotellaceae bacterium]|jgi:hypothetical protein|nr:TolB-like 6-bladed beta-propeller domain-containing protein [Prevotellaceae bacterium]